MSTTDDSTGDVERYVKLDDVPMGTDDFSEERKQANLSDANGQLEADVNGGAPIENPERIHATAANAWASYLLYLPFHNPNEASVGTGPDTDEESLEYAREYRDIYDRKVESINDSAGDEGEGGDRATDARSALL